MAACQGVIAQGGKGERDNFHATLVEGGQYLWHCLCYVELNRVRCGVVRHPREWEWVVYHEIMGQRWRSRLLDLERLCWRLATESVEELRADLEAALQERIALDQVKRESRWTERLAVGSLSFVERIEPLILSRRETEVTQTGVDVWALQEASVPYGQETGPKSGAKTLN
jgi:putative transposase